ncbi:hypothetical protein AB0G04_20885 [Actinoplanes sp. NPDC023801]|uniref:hypothetical protein n=1 Tax=Actinoplanes sp. NPDC023801 TaxID=3154595 RepID=UPI0033D54739
MTASFVEQGQCDVRPIDRVDPVRAEPAVPDQPGRGPLRAPGQLGNLAPVQIGPSGKLTREIVVGRHDQTVEQCGRKRRIGRQSLQQFAGSHADA